ncbi:MAG: FCD domain-containing protein [Acidobacteriota bacterium]|nr:FCD domain-containing protein [Acidobacteriota bacterium]
MPISPWSIRTSTPDLSPGPIKPDLDFHRYIWQRSDNETLLHLLELTAGPLLAFVSIVRNEGLQHLRSVVQDHGQLVDALRKGNRQKIRAAFESAATKGYKPFLTEGPETAAARAFGFLDIGA